MQIVQNWSDVLRRAWSVRLMVLAAILSGAEVAVQVLATGDASDLPPGLFAIGSGLLSAAALAARLVAQRGLSLGGDDA